MRHTGSNSHDWIVNDSEGEEDEVSANSAKPTQNVQASSISDFTSHVARDILAAPSAISSFTANLASKASVSSVDPSTSSKTRPRPRPAYKGPSTSTNDSSTILSSAAGLREGNPSTSDPLYSQDIAERAKMRARKSTENRSGALATRPTTPEDKERAKRNGRSKSTFTDMHVIELSSDDSVIPALLNDPISKPSSSSDPRQKRAHDATYTRPCSPVDTHPSQNVPYPSSLNNDHVDLPPSDPPFSSSTVPTTHLPSTPILDGDAKESTPPSSPFIAPKKRRRVLGSDEDNIDLMDLIANGPAEYEPESNGHVKVQKKPKKPSEKKEAKPKKKVSRKRKAKDALVDGENVSEAINVIPSKDVKQAFKSKEFILDDSDDALAFLPESTLASGLNQASILPSEQISVQPSISISAGPSTFAPIGPGTLSDIPPLDMSAPPYPSVSIPRTVTREDDTFSLSSELTWESDDAGPSKGKGKDSARPNPKKRKKMDDGAKRRKGKGKVSKVDVEGSAELEGDAGVQASIIKPKARTNKRRDIVLSDAENTSAEVMSAQQLSFLSKEDERGAPGKEEQTQRITHVEAHVLEKSKADKENTSIEKPVPAVPPPTPAPVVNPRRSITHTVPRKGTISDLIRRVNSRPDSPFASPSPAAACHSPYAKASRSMLMRIAPLHPNRRTPPPAPPRPPAPKKSKKMLEMEERWEMELAESVDGWVCLSEEERAGLMRAKKAMELGYED